jgi:hypothetical protein
MPVERFPRGRRYTERTYLRVDGELTEQDVELLERNHEALERATTLEAKLLAATGCAERQLARSGLPGDPYDPLFPMTGCESERTGNSTGTQSASCDR